MLRNFATPLAVLALLTSATIAYSSPVILDTFDSPPGGQQTTPNVTPIPGSFPPTSGVGFFNATRTVSWLGTGAGTGGTFDDAEGVFVNFGSATGQLRLSSDLSSVQVNIDYSNFGTQDFTGFTGLELDFGFLDRAGNPFLIELELQTTGGSLLGSLTIPPGPSGPLLAFIPFSSLSGPGNLGSVTGVIVRLNDNGSPNQAVDFRLNELRLPIVPEPGTVALFGLGLLGIVGVTLRRRFSASLTV